ncbi:MAG: DUF2147 domain-containing protein [Saprospiraceae bacterium]|nr:DUF2147 domain-containing protein [Saprospiraceae bacterium]
MRKWYIGVALLLCSVWAQAQKSPVGIWKTIDDKTGEAKSYVEIYEQSGKFHGKIIKLLKSPADKVCEKCTGEKKDKPLMGMVILSDLKPYDYYWRSGTIMDPENGNEYGCSAWFEKNKPDELRVRGKHWTGIFRTQTWYRVRI